MDPVKTSTGVFFIVYGENYSQNYSQAQDLYNEIYGPPIYDVYYDEDQVEEGGNEDLVLNNIDEVGLHVVEQLEQTKDVPIIKADEVDYTKDQAFRYMDEYEKLSVDFAWDNDIVQRHVFTSCYIIMESVRIQQLFMARLIHHYALVDIDEVCQNCLFACEEFCHWMVRKKLIEDHG